MVVYSGKKVRSVFSRCVWFVMAFSAVVSIFTIASFPLVKSTMLRYKVSETICSNDKCDQKPICLVNETVLGSEFANVENYYTFPICSFAVLANFFLVMRIFGSRFVNIFLTTFAFFCLIVFPIRFTFLAMQTLEFTTVGGDFYTLMIWDREQYNCPLYSGYVDAVFLMHLRFILLVLDFLTFHALIVSVPLYYVDDKITRDKYSAVYDEKMSVFAHPASLMTFQDV